MAFKCIGCGAEFEYKDLLKSNLKCTSCKTKRSNIWVKQLREGQVSEVLAR